MQESITALEKKAIKLALNQDWASAIDINKEILHQEPENLNALVRLATAYLQSKEFTKAEKLYKQVLKLDPINKIALKNIEFAKNKKTNKVPTNGKKAHVREPGTTHSTNVEITEKGFTAERFVYGDNFDVKVTKQGITLSTDGRAVAIIKDSMLTAKMLFAKENNAQIEAIFLKGEKKNAEIMFRSSIAIFKGEKQDVRPYMKKGSFDEDAVEVEVESYDD